MDLEQARAVLVDHARNPRNQLRGGAEAGAAIGVGGVVKRGECRNPLCGDFVRVHVKHTGARIENLALEVQGCTICTASASIMSENARGLTDVEIEELRLMFQNTLSTSDSKPWPAALEGFRAFSHLRVNPARIPCALIPWYALKEALASS